MKEADNPLSDALRTVIGESGLALIAIERATGVKRASIMRFMRKERSLRLDIADRLAAFFGLEVIQSKQRKDR